MAALGRQGEPGVAVPGQDHRGHALPAADGRPLLRAGKTKAEVEALPLARAFGIRDGNGIVFVSNLGEVMPSGFLPVSVGNVKERSLVELYRDEPLMRSLRDPDQFKGRCGACEYHDWCGGSRARAFAWAGDPLESDPLCPYVPGHAVPVP